MIEIIVEIFLGALGLLSIGYIMVLYISSVEKEKEKVENESYEASNDHYWASINAHASNLRQRPITHSYDNYDYGGDSLPLPHLQRPGARPPLPPAPLAADNLIPLYNHQQHHRNSDPPALSPAQPPLIVPLYDTKLLATSAQQSHPPQLHADPAGHSMKHTNSGLRNTQPLVNFGGNSSASSASTQASLTALYPPPPLPPGVERPAIERRRSQSFDQTQQQQAPVGGLLLPPPIAVPRAGSTSSTSSSSSKTTPTRRRSTSRTSPINMIYQQSIPEYNDTVHVSGGATTGLTSTVASSTSIPHGTRSFHDATYTSIAMADMTLLHVIGGGAFGQVWKATWKGTPVAVKVLSSSCQLGGSEEELQVFVDEVQMLACLRHPNICLFLGACLKPPNRFIVTELVSRGSLWEALRAPNLFHERGPADVFHWPWWVIRRVLDGTCRGLVYLHGNEPPIIHRDLKSANLLLDDSFHVKICDFGLARLRDLGNTMTANVGTTQWTAPEVLSGKEYNELADIYSLGVVAWEMLTGKCPFENITNQMEIAVEVVHRKSRPPLSPHCPKAVAAFIQCCWEDQPSRRMSAARALTELEKAIPIS